MDKIVKAEDLDQWGDDYAGTIRDLFAENYMAIAPYEHPYEALVNEDGDILGASTFGFRHRDEGSFSITVTPDARRQGVAKKLVQSIVDQHKNTTLRPWVVNPVMAHLLEGMGFEPDGEWSQDNPYMERTP
ncbi:MAG: hypothetical protein UY48_C0006G0054 [Candidatus Gottesmanbacteria bacterium GW2011_GWB1_49_7]|uniref:N-acetyltransferase domain-containing protein n=1 Tax=Candidatus Gottesmanbacteria bacterium GW2011_GWB1_49_7 TaxID=1618448 RepID=A0A0G1W2K8_9BACT|nr:MAG: hypothetical protein UY48_C0006G0054 [Candidatus Gottesmanbacteria bacterium GW2011_GWB1_49_7]